MKQIIIVIALFGALPCWAQELTQNVKGRVIDADSEVPAIGATIMLEGSDPLIGTATDVDGYFVLEGVPVGRASLQINYIGYEGKTMKVMVNSGKEVFVKIALIENFTKMNEFVVEGQTDKREVINEMTLVSARTFSTEETKRHAGSFNDPARMVANYAGVSGNAQGKNDIVVRGNSPKGILWRLEGIEVPNPNHFAREGSTGGSINALNSSMLANSDFLTGAFAPEYGNAASGVFDMKLRQGNSDKREYSFSLGLLGTDFTIEGPFKKGSRASYLVNYRYSSLGILDDAGIVDFGGVPRYQDATFKIFVPTKEAGIFTLFGMGGISSITNSHDDTIPNTDPKAISVFNANLGVVGLNHVYLINNKTYVKSSLSIATNGSGNALKEKISEGNYEETFTASLTKLSAKAQATLNHKLNSKAKLVVGAIYTEQFYSFFSEYQDEFGKQIRPLDNSGNAGFFQGFVSLKQRVRENITMVGGVHYMNLILNGSQSIEPRLAFAWKANDVNTFNAGYGKHSKVESMLNYLAEATNIEGVVETPNKSLELPKAHHYVIGYDRLLTANTHVKIEAYYQYLADVPIEDDPESSYSLINQKEWYTTKDLVNDGKGENYGIEITLERFFVKNFYYMFTGSLYKSRYLAKDNVWRDTRFDGTYSSNFLLGKEFRVGSKKKNKFLTLNIKSSFLGGNRYTPIDLEASIAKDATVRDLTKPFSKKGDDVIIINIAGGYKVNRPRATHEIKFEILNVTNNAAKVTEYYNRITGGILVGKQLPLLPNLIYTVQF